MQRSLGSLVSPVLLVLGGCTVVIEEPPPELTPPGGEPPLQKLAPQIVATEQSVLSPAPGETVTFGVVAEDPQNSRLTFEWVASTGTLEGVETSAATSHVFWLAPACVPFGVAPDIVVTVTNELSLSATATFTIGGLPNCSGDGEIFAIWNTGGEVDTVVVPEGTSEVEFLVWGGGGGGGAPGPGGGGAWLDATFEVTAGDVLEVRVASGGDEWGGGGGASYVLRNGEIMLVAAGGGGGGHDGCSGCSQEQDAQAGTGGGGGPVGGGGQDGWDNNYYETNSGAGRGGNQTSGGAGGISNDRSPYDPGEYTANGLPGLEHQGGRAIEWGAFEPPPAQGHLGGGGIGNGSSGGGGSGWFGGGSGASKYTYTGGGGGGGASWIHPSAGLVGTDGGNGQEPGGQNVIGYQNDAGRGGEPLLEPFGAPSTPGQAGLIILKL